MKRIFKTNILNDQSRHGVNSWSMSKFNSKCWSRSGLWSRAVSWLYLSSKMGYIRGSRHEQQISHENSILLQPVF